MRAARLIPLAALALFASGCMFSKVRRDQRLVSDHVEVVAEIDATDWSGLPLLATWGRLPGPDDDDGLMTVGTPRTLTQPREVAWLLEPGRYVIGAFEDADHNGHHDLGERGVLSEPFEVRAGEEPPRIALRIREPYTFEAIEDYELSTDVNFAAGEIAALDDDRFNHDNAEFGLWQPIKFAREQRPGVYMLEPYDPARTPVLFVHGMSGYPQQFAPLIDALDRERFQAWVFLYPSGYSLDELAEFLRDIVVKLELEFDYPRACLVAHSMGGLVARGFLAQHPTRVRSFVTLASPLDGMSSAAMGVKLAPEVVMSWYDLAPGSPYLQELYAKPLHPGVEYHLLFAHDGGDSDGTVPIASQLRDEAQAEAEIVLGYTATHVGILRSANATAQVLTALDRCRGDLDAPRVAPREADDHSGLD